MATLVLKGSNLSPTGILNGINTVDRTTTGTLTLGTTFAINAMCVSSGSTVSGTGAVVVGGTGNAVAGNRSVSVGGSGNTTSAAGAIVIGGSGTTVSGVDSLVLNGHAGTMTIGLTNHVLIKDTLFYSPVFYNGAAAGETFSAANFVKGVISLGNGFIYTTPTAASLATECGVTAGTFGTATNRVIFEVIFKMPTDTNTATLNLGVGLSYVNVPSGGYTVTGGVIMKFEFMTATTIAVTVVGAGGGGGGGSTLTWANFLMDTPVARFTSFSNEASEFLNINFIGTTLNIDIIALTDGVTAVGQTAYLDIPVATGIPCTGVAGVKYTGTCEIEEVTALAITGTSVASPTVITVASHTFVAGDLVAVTGNASITESTAYTVQAAPAPTGTTFAIDFNNLTGLAGGFVIGLAPVTVQIGNVKLDSNVTGGRRITLRTTGSFAQNTRYRILSQVTYKS